MTHRLRLLVLVPALALSTLPAAALNGHFVHGFGARNSAMGGAGAALVHTDPLVALAFNPAALTALEGDQFQLSLELIDGNPETSSTVPTPFGPFSGTTEDDTGAQPLPAFGWTRHDPGSSWAVGFGSIAMAGFVTDYPQDSANPILLPQPQGFGRVNSEYQYLRIPLSVAYQASPSLSIGGALTLGYARLGATPAPFAAPDCSSPTDCYYPAANQEGAFGGGFQVGLHWRVTPEWSFAASYTSEQSFEDFEYHSEVANPNLPTFGSDRSFEFNVDVPAQLTVGAAWAPTSNVDLALDVRWIGYDGVDGLGTAGFNPDGSVRGFGWDDITVVALGGEWRVGAHWALRAGYNLAESPIDEDLVAATTPAPATFEDHATFGIGYRLDDRLSLDLAYYRAFENEVSGPLVSPAGPIPGTTVTQSNESDSVVTTLGFSF
ncbi:MAG: outer membrane protein transport protein [Acidobacteriota bacterium]